MYDIIVIGSGPGGYPAAIRAAQLGKKVAIVERESLGGVCLNWGCIPTKALLKSASVLEYAKTAIHYGINVSDVVADLPAIIKRSRDVAAQMSKGVEFLLSKNGVEIIRGFGKITADGEVDVDGRVYATKNIIIATGARPREMPGVVIDGVRVVTSRHALVMEKLPVSMVVIGSGAIGAEFATFYNALGVKVTIVEYAARIAPLEDEDSSSALERAMRKAKMTIMTSTAVKSVETPTAGGCLVHIEGKKGAQTLECDVVLSAVGVVANLENIGLEEACISVERGKIVVDQFCRTSRTNIYAIGDVIPTPALAHVATAEAILAVEHISGLEPKPLNYSVTPSCIYTTPEVSSVGMTEVQAKEAGYEVRIGKFPFTASGKATAAGARDGLVKLVFDTVSDKLLGAHFVGLNVTELVGEASLGLTLGATARDIIHTIHAHPTMHEAFMEAAAAAHQEAIHTL